MKKYQRKSWRRRTEPVSELKQEVYAKRYATLAERSFTKSDRKFARLVAKAIPKKFKRSVIDLGSGPGNIAIPLALIRPDLKIVCFDFSAKMLAIARSRAKVEKVSLKKISFRQGDLTKLASVFPKNANFFIYSNTVIHELPTKKDLEKTFEGLAAILGDKGGVYIRDLAFPKNAHQAKAWREEILKGTKIPEKEEKMFEDSQHAAFDLKDVDKAINRAKLQGRGKLEHLTAPQSRYWIYIISPK